MAEIIYPRKAGEITLYELTLRAIANLALQNALERLETESSDGRKSGLLSKGSEINSRKRGD